MFWWHSSAFIFWGAIAVIAVASSYFRYREGESRNRMLQTLAEKGAADLARNSCPTCRGTTTAAITMACNRGFS